MTDDTEAEELRRYEEERERRRLRRNALSGRIAAWTVAAALAFLAYDSGGAAVHAHAGDRPWRDHAIVSAGCVLALCALLALLLRRRRG